jgi:SAM-dependent MidA family methyltransferase
LHTKAAAEGAPDLSVHFPQLSLPHGKDLLEVLPEGFTIEVSPAAQQWWRQAAMALESGKLVAIDYGQTADELLLPERKEGTLRAYYRHRASSDVLARPGEQDITAHVNFTAIRTAGESAGLKTERYETQAQFLTDIAAQAWREEGSSGEWTRERRRQFQTLTHPEHLGRSFRVLVQSRSR